MCTENQFHFPMSSGTHGPWGLLRFPPVASHRHAHTLTHTPFCWTPPPPCPAVHRLWAWGFPFSWTGSCPGSHHGHGAVARRWAEYGGGGTNWRDIRTAGGGQRPPEGEMQSWPLTGAGIWVGDTAGPQQGPQGAQTLREAGALLALLGVRPHAHSPGEMKVHGCVGCVCVIG